MPACRVLSIFAYRTGGHPKRSRLGLQEPLLETHPPTHQPNQRWPLTWGTKRAWASLGLNLGPLAVASAESRRGSRRTALMSARCAGVVWSWRAVRLSRPVVSVLPSTRRWHAARGPSVDV